jgi:hypothetical protein
MKLHIQRIPSNHLILEAMSDDPYKQDYKASVTIPLEATRNEIASLLLKFVWEVLSDKD